MEKEKIGVGYNVSENLLCVYDSEKDLHIKIEKCTVEKVKSYIKLENKIKLNISTVLKNEIIVSNKLFNNVYECFNYCIENDYFSNVKLIELNRFINYLTK